MKKLCKHFIIHGHVQGVFYRANAAKEAQKLKITGWVKNTSNGNVEVLACGTSEQLEAFKNWLWKGPTLARVSEVIETDEPFNDEFHDFQIIYE